VPVNSDTLAVKKSSLELLLAAGHETTLSETMWCVPELQR